MMILWLFSLSAAQSAAIIVVVSSGVLQFDQDPGIKLDRTFLPTHLHKRIQRRSNLFLQLESYADLLCLSNSSKSSARYFISR